MIKQFLILSWNHNIVESSFLDTISLSKKEISLIQTSLLNNNSIIELSILQTCNRIEFYFITENFENIEFWIYNQYNSVLVKNINFKNYKPIIFVQKEAINHFCRLSSGLESMAIGERQILQQVKISSDAIYTKNSMSVLKQIYSLAISCAIEVHKQTKLDFKSSIGQSAVEVALKTILNPQKILIIGAGNMATLIANSLAENNIKQITISNRSDDKGKVLANDFNIFYRSLKIAISELSSFDIVFTATSSEKKIISKDILLRSNLTKKSILFVDISIPRNIDPNIKEVDGMNLLDMDSIKNHKSDLSQSQKSTLVAAQKIINYLTSKNAIIVDNNDVYDSIFLGLDKQ